MTGLSINARLPLATALALLGLSLAGCDGDRVKRAFSMQREMPDEYTVVTRAPLSMPPSERLTLPGRAGASPGDNSSLQALEILSPEVALHPVKGEDSPGQRDLEKAAAEADEGSATHELAAPGHDLTERLMFWRKASDAVVDERRENARLRRVTGLGGRMNAGETPVREAR